MVSPSAGSVVLVRFPFSDLSSSKLRPAVVLALAEGGDWILCQITSRPYADSKAIQISDTDFLSGGLRKTSFVRPGKLFTANTSLMAKEVGILTSDAHRRVVQAVVALLKPVAY
jgi:mRNA interferase MazF